MFRDGKEKKTAKNLKLKKKKRRGRPFPLLPNRRVENNGRRRKGGGRIIQWSRGKGICPAKGDEGEVKPTPFKCVRKRTEKSVLNAKKKVILKRGKTEGRGEARRKKKSKERVFVFGRGTAFK